MSRSIKYTYRVIPNYISKLLCINETWKYYESRDIKYEF